ncbi:mCG146875 [Mus musculus]|nr:mCG146875 [Mus musculus]
MFRAFRDQGSKQSTFAFNSAALIQVVTGVCVWVFLSKLVSPNTVGLLQWVFERLLRCSTKGN